VSYDQLFTAAESRVVRIVAKRFSDCSSLDSDDLKQVAAEAVWRAREDELRDEESLLGYQYRVASHAVAQLVRAEKAHRRRGFYEAVSINYAAASSNPTDDEAETDPVEEFLLVNGSSTEVEISDLIHKLKMRLGETELGENYINLLQSQLVQADLAETTPVLSKLTKAGKKKFRNDQVPLYALREAHGVPRRQYYGEFCAIVREFFIENGYGDEVRWLEREHEPESLSERSAEYTGAEVPAHSAV
jgi:hypothetical protein